MHKSEEENIINSFHKSSNNCQYSFLRNFLKNIGNYLKTFINSEKILKYLSSYLKVLSPRETELYEEHILNKITNFFEENKDVSTEFTKAAYESISNEYFFLTKNKKKFTF